MRFLLLLALLICGWPAWGQQVNLYCATGTGFTTWQPASSTNPCPITGSFTDATLALSQTPVAPGTATATKGVLLGGQYDSTQKTLTDGQQAAYSMSARGALLVATGADTFTVAGGGSAGTAATGVMSVQGIASMTPIQNVSLPSTTLGGMAPTPATQSAVQSCTVLKSSAGQLYSLSAAIGATTGYIMVFNATAAPGDGAVTPAWPPIRVVSDGTSGWASYSFPYPLTLGTGITVCFSSTGPFTKTASATAILSGQIQ